MIKNKNRIKRKTKKIDRRESSFSPRFFYCFFFFFLGRWRATDYKRGTNNSGRVTRHRIKTDARYISRAWSSPLCPGKNARRFARSGCETFSNSSRRSRYAARISVSCCYRRRGQRGGDCWDSRPPSLLFNPSPEPDFRIPDVPLRRECCF